MGTILVIEDEIPILVALEDALERAGFSVLSARNGQQGLKYALEEEYDLIVLDLMLPKMNGDQILKRIRAQDKYIPVIILTAKSQERDKVNGFDLGADDYVTKPFGMKELIARIHTRLKNSQRHTNQVATYTLEEIDFDFKAMTAISKKRALEFSVRELELLQYFITHKGRVLTREQILEDVWRYEVEQAPSTRSIDNYILKLRQKIEKNSENPKHLVTVYGKGYRFEE
jgi:DNA-binding response OmpR family regulator